MGEQIEMWFDEFGIDGMVSLLQELSSNGERVKTYQLYLNTPTIVEITWSSRASLSHALKLEDKGWLTVKLFELPISEMAIRHCWLNIFCWNTDFDLELFFGHEDIPVSRRASFVECMMEFGADIAHRYTIEDYYGGLEPASDEKTRFFTQNKKSPNSGALVKLCQSWI